MSFDVRQWSRRQVFLGLVAVTFLVWLGSVAAILLGAYADLRTGRAAMKRVHARDGVAAVLSGEVGGDLRQAEKALSHADNRLGNPLLTPTRIIPFVGRQVRSMHAIAHAGRSLAAAGADGVASVGRLLSGSDHSPPSRSALVKGVGVLAAQTQRRLDRVSLGPRMGLLPPLARAYNELSRELTDVQTGLAKATSGAGALTDWLEGPRRYLVAAANNAEMRAGSGMFLSVGVLTTSHGQVALTDFRTVFGLNVPPGAVPIQGDMADRWGWLHPNEDWRNLMLSPNFTQSAPLAADMWAALGEAPVDGVIMLDPVVLEQLLNVLGPVTVDDRTIDATHVVDELLHDQYLRFPTLEERPERREALGRIARATFAVLDSGTWNAPDLANAIASSIRGRHLMVWSRRPAEQAAWRDAGADGELRPDSLLVSVVNRGGNKLDRYLTVGADLACNAKEKSTTPCTLSLDIKNVTPAGEPPYIAGPHPGTGVSEGDYIGILTVNLPGAAHDSSILGVDALAVAGADGASRVVGYQVVIPRNGHLDVSVRFELPGAHGAVRVEPSARVPGISWSSGGKTWQDGAAFTVRR